MRTLLLLTFALAAAAADSTRAARPEEGLSRLHSYGAWLVACDNTRACEAQGYADESHPDPTLRRAALTVTRQAGPAQAPVLRLLFASMANTDRPPEPGQPVQVQAGALRLTLPPLEPRNEMIQVPASQAPALLAAVQRAGQMLITAGSERWWVSLQGASAALLKMDDLQGRVGTVGALVRPGPRSEAGVPAPPAPEVVPLRLPPTTAADLALEPQLRAALPPRDDDCPGFDPAEPLQHVVRLGPQALLVSQLCGRGAYQAASRLWRLEAAPPFRATALKPPRLGPDTPYDGLLVIENLEATGGFMQLHESAKGRGIGDCWSTHEWTWTAQGLALVSADTSDCRAFEGGGLRVTLWRTRLR